MKLNAKLTPREKDVAEFIGFGYSIKETANALGIAFDTVKVIMKHIYEKVDIQKSTELAKYCYCRRFGLHLSQCEPARRIIAGCFLVLFLYSMFIPGEQLYRRARRIRTNETEIVEREHNN